MIKIDAQKKLLRYEELRKEGLEDQADQAIQSIYEDLIRRDDEELQCNDLYDLAAIAAYSRERARQLLALLEREMNKMPDEERKAFDAAVTWLRIGAMQFLEVELEQ